MDIIKSSTEKPTPIIVGLLLLTMFGIISFYYLPYQLTPNVTEPVVSVSTTWLGATPYEVERDIIEEQERVLQGVEDLLEMESTATNGAGEVMLTFAIGTDIDQAMNRVSNKLNEVKSYPENVDKPIVKRSGEDQAPKIWMVLSTLDENPKDINTYLTYFREEVLPHFLRINGVADVVTFGGGESQMQIQIDDKKLAEYNITIPELIQIIQTENSNISAGILDIGAKDYRIRTTAQFNSEDEIKNIVVKSDNNRVIRLSEFAKVDYGIERLKTYFRFDKTVEFNSEDSINASKSKHYKMINAGDGKSLWKKSINGIDIGIKATARSNIIDLTNNLELTNEKLNKELLKDKGLYIEIVYDERDYPLTALGIVKENIVVGSILAVIVLLLFLRNVRSTVIVATVIPMVIVINFAFLFLFDRSLNVVSLAGIAFSVGMIIDCSIVVLENIQRHINQGNSIPQATHIGTKEVWGAILASTLTNVIVFLPIIFIKEDVGQLFKDISIAITTITLLGMLASVIFIPMLVSVFYKKKNNENGFTKSIGSRFPKLNAFFSKLSRIIETFGDKFNENAVNLLKISMKSARTRILTIVVLMAFAIISCWLLIPKMEYLPQGNMNFLINVIIPPAGTSYQERADIGNSMFAEVDPHFGVYKDGIPPVNYTFFVGGEDLIFCGASCADKTRCGDLVPLFSKAVNNFPGAFGISMQAGIFQNRLGRSRSIQMNISGSNENLILAAARETMFHEIPEYLPGSQTRSVPSLDVSYPEIKFIPNRERLKAVGLSAEEFGKIIDVMLDGRKIGDYKKEGNKKIDLILKCTKEVLATPEDIFNTSITVPGGNKVPVYTLCELKRTTGLSQIRHLESKRTITIEITPPQELALESALDVVNTKIIPNLKNKGMLKDLDTRTTGSAGKLTQAKDTLQWNIVLAILICYLLMAILYNNFIYPIVILFTLPFGISGGFIFLKFVNLFIGPAPFDIMTVLGFIMLVGIVVNNPILIVHQSINNIHLYNMDYKDAVIEATRSRIKPIFMSTLTAIFGMLPLVISPGAGSELYRGLGSAVLGGLVTSTFFTIYFIPPLLMFVIKYEKRKI